MTTALMWFRQDLRLSDNPALYHAMRENDAVIPVYIYDDSTPWRIGAAQKWWLHHSLTALQQSLKQQGSTLFLKRGHPEKVILELCRLRSIHSIYWNRCYEPALEKRDEAIQKKLLSLGLKVYLFNSSLINEPWEITNLQGSYYKIFTPYWRKCMEVTHISNILPIPKFKKTLKVKSENLNRWDLLPQKPNWAKSFAKKWHPGEKHAKKKLAFFLSNRLEGYLQERDFLAKNVTSELSPHLHFGEIGPRQIWTSVKHVDDPKRNPGQHFLRQLFWREFSYYLLYHFPEFSDKNFQNKFDHFAWKKNKKALTLWQKGKTGYPIIDAGMQELWQTGYMHNRARMLVASFLTKYLLIHWRFGAEWFWDTLVDADLANNSMGWQWVAGTGVDAAPYFRIFNPVLQGKKFDAQGAYVRRWLPVLAKLPNRYIHEPWKANKNTLDAAGVILGKNYPYPIVDSLDARQRALEYYRKLKE